MGDVVTALGRAVQEEGHAVEAVIPKFDTINYDLVEDFYHASSFAFGGTEVKVWKGVVEAIPTTFLEPQNGMFWVGCIYGRNDDHSRFAFFVNAAMEYLKRLPESVRPHVVHCHDWPTAPAAWADRGDMRVVFTIHNLSYGADLIGRAMQSSEVATTVSPTYASEISGSGCIAPYLHKLHGIRNGIDSEIWDPEGDPFLPVTYDHETCAAGKAAARKTLRARLKMADIDVPIVACVTRLVAQKGIHLIKHAAWRTVERGGQFVLLGSAPDPAVQGEFNALKEQLERTYHDRVALVFQYDEPLSHTIYAASDMFLVPSMFEPCGLTQMIAMAYGSVPVVRRTGGLADTVFDVDTDTQRAADVGMAPNGYVFEATDTAGLDTALNRALAAWFEDRDGFRQLQAAIMRQDWSWHSPALDYIELYYK
jgi:starch synthase